MSKEKNEFGEGDLNDVLIQMEKDLKSVKIDNNLKQNKNYELLAMVINNYLNDLVDKKMLSYTFTTKKNYNKDIRKKYVESTYETIKAIQSIFLVQFSLACYGEYKIKNINNWQEILKKELNIDTTDIYENGIKKWEINNKII
jgi:hypothetical protein